TQTDVAGNYSFADLAPDTYQVSLLHSTTDNVTFPNADGTRSVPLADGQSVHDVNFGVLPAPDLIGSSFRVAAPATALGQPLPVNYTVTNQGGDAPAFDVGLYLSADGTIGTSGTLLDTIHVADGLAAGASVSGSVTVTLPEGASPGSPPTGFDSLSEAYV